jgi:putative DNA primase/helicase
MNKLDFKHVAAVALSQLPQVLDRFLPGGKYDGKEYTVLNPNRSDSRAGSFKINIDTAIWADFATGDRGNDAISLLAYVLRLSQGDACKELSNYLGAGGLSNAKPPAKKPNNKLKWSAIFPIPEQALIKCPNEHFKLGQPQYVWEYRNESGDLLLKVLRFDTLVNGEKQKEFRPLTYCRSDKGREEWRWIAPFEHKPLYGLNELTSKPNATVVLAEGEKAADAAKQLFPSCVCMTWLNGAKAENKADFSPLKGRTVLIWPDNDKAGLSCAAQLTTIIKGIDCKKIALINLGVFEQKPVFDEQGKACFDGKAIWPEKADAADALELGWTADHINLLKEAKTLFIKDTATTSAATIEPMVPQGFRLGSRGVEAFINTDENGNEVYRLICAPLKILARTFDANDTGQNWGILVNFNDYDGNEKSWNIPMKLFATDNGTDIRKGLLDRGLRIEAIRDAGRKVLQYLQASAPDNRVGLVSKLGWHADAFVLPDSTIGHTEKPLLFDSESVAPCKLAVSGSVLEWQKHVASYCSGNELAVLAVCIAFSGPLVGMLGLSENIGFHFYGDSSLGKSTLLNIACSVYGNPNEYRKTWRTTDNALEGIAATHSDMLLALDELNQVDPRIIDNVVYMLGNGKGKNRSGSDYKGQSSLTWQLAFISNGEKTLEQYLGETGKSVTGGMEMRFIAVYASPHEDEHTRKQLGIFNDCKGFAGGADLSDYLRKAVNKYHGSAFQAFISKLVTGNKKDITDFIRIGVEEFKQRTLGKNANGQVGRAAEKFAVAALAGELATVFGLTGWNENECIDAAQNQFNAWLDRRGGTSNIEEMQILKHVASQIELYGEKYFRRWDKKNDDNSTIIDEHVPSRNELWGFRITEEHKNMLDGNTSEHCYLVTKQAFETQLCKGFDHKRVAVLLRDQGILILRDSERARGRRCTREKLPGYGSKDQEVYKFKASSLTDVIERFSGAKSE